MTQGVDHMQRVHYPHLATTNRIDYQREAAPPGGGGGGGG